MALLDHTHDEVTHGLVPTEPRQSTEATNGRAVLEPKQPVRVAGGSNKPSMGDHSQRRNGRESHSSDAARREINGIRERSLGGGGKARPYLVGAIVVAAALSGGMASAAKGARVGAALASRQVRRVQNLNGADATFVILALAGIVRRLGKRELAG